MQQPMNQPEPIGGQQHVQQQMVLCPVRFVYETQVLVQPGDQIQPNQTFFINPNNPPPWMQNRPAPSPVVYVQQLPNNMIQSVQQHMDQNQLYLPQNFANFQLQQHMLAQNQEIRPTMQLANIMPNMVQNVQQNIQTNERSINQNTNTGQMQANAQNMIQSQLNVANNTRQITNPNNQTVEVQRQVYMNVRPQMNQQMNITRPVMSLNQIQNMQAMANMQNVQIQQTNVGQTFMHNIGQRPLPQNVNAVRPQIITNNVMNVEPISKIRELPPSEANKAVSNTVGSAVPNVRNFAQNYNCRPIQPRRRFVENNANIPKMQQQQVPVQTPQHIPVQTAPTQYINDTKNNSHQVVTNIAANTTYLNNPNISRKRKSESPDEIQNKMAVNPTMKPIYKNLQHGIIITKLSNEIGTNTSPVHKPNINANINHNNTQFQMNTSTPMVIVENTGQIDANQIKNITDARIVSTPVVSENDKLIRNTVYTQARGRLLQDKISNNLTPQPVENKKSSEIATNTEVQAKVDAIMSEIRGEKAMTVPEVQTEKVAPVTKQTELTEKTTVSTNSQTDKTIFIKPQTEKATTPTKVQTETVVSKKQETPERKPEVIEKPVVVQELVNNEINAEKVEKPKPSEESEVKLEESLVNEPKSEVKDEKLEITEKIVSKQDILTHVVDGYVIQESNFAFPIRKPLKEKTLYANPKAESETTDALKECMKEEMKNTGVDVQLLPFHYLLLNSDKKEQEVKEDKEESEKANPFAELQHAIVKSWTVDDLSSYLLKFNWKETASVFQDHEIDGESLFLVSKNQLVSIGVSEENADVICDFVKS